MLYQTWDVVEEVDRSDDVVMIGMLSTSSDAFLKNFNKFNGKIIEITRTQFTFVIRFVQETSLAALSHDQPPNSYRFQWCLFFTLLTNDDSVDLRNLQLD